MSARFINREPTSDEAEAVKNFRFNKAKETYYSEDPEKQREAAVALGASEKFLKHLGKCI